MKYVIPAAIAIGVGLITLASYLVNVPVLISVRLALTDWAIILGALAVLLGIFNLMLVHARRIDAADPGWVYSFFTVLALLITLVLGVVEGFGAGGEALYQPTAMTNILFRGVVVASLASLGAVVVVFLVTAAVRMLRDKPQPWSYYFLGVVIVVLVGWFPFSMLAPIRSVREWIINVPAVAGARGILLGVALGALVVGLRMLMGIERPYQD